MRDSWRLAICGALALAALGAPAARGDEPEQVPSFRREFLPAEALDRRTWKDGYLPVDAKEFEQRLRDVYDRARGAPATHAPRIERATYRARLEAEDLLVGTAELELSAVDEPTLLALVPFSGALESAAWNNPEARPALVGVAPDGGLRALVEGEQLQLAWSQRGERTASGAVQFALELPGSPLSRLEIEAPDDVDIVVDHGIATAKPQPAGEATLWSVELGGYRRIGLRVVPKNTAGERRALTLVRQAMTYKFSTRGINLAAQLRLDVHGEPLERILVDLDPSLHLVSARYGEQDLPWSATTDLQSGQSHVLLEFPEPVSGAGRVLQLSAVTPLTTDERWSLPGLQVRGMAWQEGTAELILPEGLLLEQLLTDGCRQSQVTPLPAPLGESIEIQYYRPGAKIELRLTVPRKQLAVETGTLVQVGGQEIVSRCSFAIPLDADARRKVRIPIHAPWTVESVESIAASRIVKWDVVERRGEPAELEIAMAGPGRLVVRGSRPLPVTASFDAAQLQMLDFSQFDAQAQLISVRAADGSELRWSGDEQLERLEPDNLTAEQLQLFVQLPDGPVFVENDVFGRASVARERRRPNYSVDIHIDAAVREGKLAETYTIHCVPDAARVERLLVHFSQPREIPLQWNLAGGNNSGQFSARKLTSGEQAGLGLPPSGEVWELLLEIARPGPFELRADRSLPFEQETPLALASVEDATTQRGTLAIRAVGDAGLSIRNRGLMSVPAELLDPNRYQTARATYHYQPSGDDLEAEPMISISPAESQQPETGAWAWSCQLASRFAAEGTCSHRVAVRIQTAGRSSLRFRLPEKTRLLGAWVDGQQLDTSGPKPEGHRVELPPGKSRALLTLYYSTPAELPGLVVRHAAPFPTLDIPVLLREWSVWMPPGFEVADSDRETPLDRLRPPTWSQRLFGPLGRDARGHIFNPLLSSDWRETFAARGRTDRTHEAGVQFVRDLGVLAGQYIDDEALTWGQLISAASDGEAQAGGALLVDADSFAQAGIMPQTPLVRRDADSPLERGANLLRGAGLAIVVSGRVVLITTAANTASFADQLLARDSDVVYVARPGRLADELQLAARDTGWSRYETATWWLTQAPEWSFSQSARPAASVGRGWHRYSLSCAADATPRVRIVSTARMQSLAWAVLLAVVGLGLWKPLVRASALVLFVAIAASLALVVPPAYTPLASAAFVGGLIALAIRMTHVPPRPMTTEDATRSTTRRSRSSIVQGAATALLAAALVHLAASIDAAQVEQQPAEAGAADAPQYVVVVPVDEDQQPVDDKYYVPEKLYEELLRLDDAGSGRPKQWLVRRAVYRGALARDPASGDLHVARHRAQFDLHVFQNPAAVRLPLSREPWEAAIASARLDGRTIGVRFTSAGEALDLGQLAAGEYRLDLELDPEFAAERPSTAFDLPIPRIAQSTLELDLPTDVTTVDVPGARGEVSMDAKRGQLLARLGATDRLSLRWPAGNATQSMTPNLEAEELIWIKVRPGTTVLDARFTYRVLSGRVRRLRLITDPRFRLLSSPDPDSPIRAVHTIPGDPQRIELELADEVNDEVTIDLSFLVTGTSGVGNLRLPRLESSDARAARRWLGVSVDPALQPRIQAGEDSRALDIAEFVGAWGSTDGKPHAAYSIPRGEPIWVLSTQPSEPQTTAEQQLDLSLASSSVGIQYEAKLTISGGVLIQLALEGPSGIEIEDVSIVDEDVQRVSRWSIDDAGLVSVFLTTPIDGEQTLSLRGRWAADRPDAFDLPTLRLLSADIKKNLLCVFRQPSVLAVLDPRPGVRPVEAPDQAPEEGLGALSRCFMIEDPAAVVAAEISPNNPTTQAVAVTHLEHQRDRWMAELNFHLNVRDGLVDSLQFEIPRQWSEPFRVEPAMRTEVVSIPGEQRRRLLLFPPEPLAGEHVVTVRGRVASSPGDRLSVPDVVPLQTQQVERYVLVPRFLDYQQVTWDTLRLSPVTLPPTLVPKGLNIEPMFKYQVTGEHFQASLKAVQREDAVPRVRLADIHLAWHDDGSYQAVAAFDVEPGGASQCELQLPAGSRLIHAAVERLPALVAAREANRWRLGLGPEQLPQRIEIIYTGTGVDSPAHQRFIAPRLFEAGGSEAELEVAETLWTVYSPPRHGLAAPQQASWRTSPAEQQLARLNSAASLVELPAEVIGEHLPEEIARWYGAWRQRYLAGRETLRGELAAGNSATQLAELAEARGLDERIETVDRRLGAARTALREPAVVDPSTELVSIARAEMLPLRFAVDQSTPALELRYASPGSDSVVARWLAALAVIVAGGAFAWWFGDATLPTFAPWIVAVVAGLAWWLLLTPSFIGLLALVVACGAAFWSQWRAFRADVA
ncbi:MAG: hypothetical protein DWQ37_13805 [Planctomycetota bacterium]|nr:MAG: hypothetical protein DWQ37_13805 [Planctomycetota bacterium]